MRVSGAGTAGMRGGASAAARWLTARLAGEQERWVLWLPVALGCGIVFYFLPDFEPPVWLGAACCALLAAAARWARRRPGMLTVLLLAAAVSGGFSVAQVRTALVAAPMLDHRHGPATVSGKAVVVESLERGRRLTLERPRIGGLAPDRTPERVRIRVSAADPPVGVGAWIRVRAILTPPPAPSAPGAFDFQRRSYFDGLGAVGFALGRPAIVAEPSARGFDGVKLSVERLRNAVAERARTALPGAEGAVAAALLTGDRGTIPGDVMADVRNSGLAHLLAISGLHVGLVAGILFFVTRGALALVPPVALRYPVKKWAAVVGVVGAFGYALLAGATIPTQRAFLMISLVLVAVLLDRRGISMRVVAWAATVVLLLHPESILGASFQLSFAAVVALVAVYEAAGPWLARHRRGGGPARGAVLYLAGVGLTTLIAGAATAPFAIANFNRMADYGLAANLAAVPVTALWIMPWGMLSLVLMPFGAEHVALVPMGWGIAAVLTVAGTVAGWPGSVTVVPAMPVWGLAAVTLGGLWLCLWRQRWRWWGAAAVAMGLGSVLLTRPPDILIGGDGTPMAARLSSGLLAVTTVGGGAFERDVWLRRAGQSPPPPAWPDGTSLDRLSCDIGGCLYRAGGVTVALVRHPAVLAEDCWVADVVIATVPVRQACSGPRLVIDRFDLWRNGAHALWLDSGQFRVESVNDSRGHRPWVVRPGPRFED